MFCHLVFVVVCNQTREEVGAPVSNQHPVTAPSTLVHLCPLTPVGNIFPWKHLPRYTVVESIVIAELIGFL